MNPGDNAIVDFTRANHSKLFKFKQKITGAAVNNGTKNVEIMGPLKYQINFWKTLKIVRSNIF